MSVEIVLHEPDLLRLGKVRVRQFLEKLRIVYRRAPIRHLDVPPPFQRGKQHKQVGGAITGVLIVMSCRHSRLGRNW